MAGEFDERDYIALEPPHYARGSWEVNGQPLINVLIERHFLFPPSPRSWAGRGVPEKRQYTALIDTGATHTVIDLRVAKELKLGKPYVYDSSDDEGDGVIQPLTVGKSYTWTKLHYPGRKKPMLCKKYDITITLSGLGRSLHLVDVPSADLRLHGIDCLIGLDLLQHGEFVMNGRSKTFQYMHID